MNTRRRVGFAVALLGLQVVDLATTALALSQGAEESNPFINLVGFPIAVTVKIAAAVGVIATARQIAEPSTFDKYLQAAVVLYLAIVLFNVTTVVRG